MEGLEFPLGEGSKFDSINYTKGQIEGIQMLLNVNKSFAEKLYKNGIMINRFLFLHSNTWKEFTENYVSLITHDPYLGVYSDGKPTSNSILMDTWYHRGIPWPEWSDVKQISKGSKRLHECNHPVRRPYVSRERQILREMSAKLSKSIDKTKEVLDFDIPVWIVSRRSDLNELLKQIQKIIWNIWDGPHELWLRGQNREYYFKRDTQVNRWLRYPDTATEVYSLLPSLGRFAISNPTSPRIPLTDTNGWQFAFAAWMFMQYPQWFRKKRGFLARLETSFLQNDVEGRHSIFQDIKFDRKISKEANHLDLWIMQNYFQSKLPLILQHYGMHTASLDVTKDMDVALFFALNMFDFEEAQFFEINSSAKSDPVIYLFARSIPYGFGGTAILPSELIMRETGPHVFPVPKRILRQQCGLLWGSNLYGWNYYADLLIGKIQLRGFIDKSSYQSGYLFPSDHDDNLYNLLCRARPELRGLIKYKL